MRAASLNKRYPAVAAAFATLASTTTALAATYNYVSWTSADVSQGTASGTIAVGSDAGVDVTFTATTADGGAGDLYGAQTGGSGTNYWTPAATYQSTAVENAPPTSDIIQLAGGENETYTVNLSQPIVDPIMAIVSLGADGSPITYNFDSPFTIVSQGTDSWGGSSTALVQLPNNVLQGSEGSGVIQFIGTYSTFSWTVPTPEIWHGFTFGILTSAALYDGGGPDGSTIVITGDAGSAASEGGLAEAGDDGGNDASSSATDGGTDATGGGNDAGSGSDATASADATGGNDATSSTDATNTGDATMGSDAAYDDVASGSSSGGTSSSGGGSSGGTASDDGGGDDATASDDGGGNGASANVGAKASCGCKAAGAGGSGDGGGAFVALGLAVGAVGLRRRRRA